ncbi:MAG: hypothetical protein ACYTEW_23155 [Planctomycetota bacterium]
MTSLDVSNPFWKMGPMAAIPDILLGRPAMITNTAADGSAHDDKNGSRRSRTAGGGQPDKSGHAVQPGFCKVPNSRAPQKIAAKTADKHCRQNHSPQGQGLIKSVEQLCF